MVYLLASSNNTGGRDGPDTRLPWPLTGSNSTAAVVHPFRTGGSEGRERISNQDADDLDDHDKNINGLNTADVTNEDRQVGVDQNSSGKAFMNKNGSARSSSHKDDSTKTDGFDKNTATHQLIIDRRRMSSGSTSSNSSTSLLLLSFNDTPNTHSQHVPLAEKPGLFRHQTVNVEPKSLSFLHTRRFSDTSKNPFLVSQNRQNQTSNNTELNKKLSSTYDKENVAISKSPSPEINATSSHPSNGDFPPLVRKKTGEIVKSSLKLSSLGNSYGRSAQSLPTTPTYKSVHFNNDSFVDVKYFREKDTPTAISAETSPVVQPAKHIPKYRWLIGDSDEESTDTDSDDDYFSLSSLDSNIDWQLEMKNVEPINYVQKIKEGPPVFLERFFLSTDKKFLKGHIATKNLAFKKSVIVKYSLNHWKIISEIDAIYVPDIPRILRKNQYDRFVFKIPLVALIEDKLVKDHINLVACIKYETAGQQFWDNNNLKNYEILLKNTVFKRHSEVAKQNVRNYLRKFTTRARKSDSRTDPDSESTYFSSDKIGGYSSSGSADNSHDYDNSEEDTRYNYDDHKLTDIYNTYTSAKDSYFPPFESLSPNTPYFKYPSTNGGSVDAFGHVNGDAPDFNDLGESLVDYKYSGLSSFYSTGPSAKTAENLAFENENKNPVFDSVISSSSSSASPALVEGSAVPRSTKTDSTNTNGGSLFSPPQSSGYSSESINGNQVLSPKALLGHDKEITQNPNDLSFNKPETDKQDASKPKYEIQKLREERPSIDSKSYQELVQNYCFFQG